MVRIAALATLLAVAAPVIPLPAGHPGGHGCPMAHTHCERAAAISCCEGGAQGHDDPAMTSARTLVKLAKKLVAAPVAVLVLESGSGALHEPATLRHFPPSRQRLARLSVLRI